MAWRATVLTLYPDAFPGPLGVSVIGTALKSGLWALNMLDIREFARNKHRSVDDTPAGGGPGMVLKPDVVAAAVDAARRQDERAGARSRPAFLMSPRGRALRQSRVRDLAAGPGVIIVAGRFEGVDQRVVEARGLEEISVGDVVTAGGEAPAMTMIEACVRLLPGVLGAQASTVEESFEGGLLEHPHFTRPRTWEGRDIPEVLLSGDHGAVARWRREEAKRTTKERRPDLWASYVETNDEFD